jgi:hypothetical protein
VLSQLRNKNFRQVASNPLLGLGTINKDQHLVKMIWSMPSTGAAAGIGGRDHREFVFAAKRKRSRVDRFQE